jgi:hypothetical protein
MAQDDIIMADHEEGKDELKISIVKNEKEAS